MSKVIFIPSENEFYKIFGKRELRQDKFYSSYEFENYIVVILGVGKVNVAAGALYYFLNYVNKDVDVFLLGIAGAYKDGELAPGDIVSVKFDYFVDEALLKEDYELLMLNELGFPICKENKTEFKVFDGIKTVDSNTVSLLSGNDFIAKKYQSKTNAQIENMEGAAFGLVCNKLGVKPYQIRAISNYCGDRNKQHWNINAAIYSLKKFLESLL